MTASTKPQPAEVTVCKSPEGDLWAANEAQKAKESDVDAPEALARRIMSLASWEPRAALDNAAEYVRVDRRDAFARGQRSRGAEVDRLSEERLRYQQERDHYRALHLNASQDDARALRAKQELLSEIFDSVAEQAGHRGCARGYEYNSVLLLIRDRITAALARGSK